MRSGAATATIWSSNAATCKKVPPPGGHGQAGGGSTCCSDRPRRCTCPSSLPEVHIHGRKARMTAEGQQETRELETPDAVLRRAVAGAPWGALNQARSLTNQTGREQLGNSQLSRQSSEGAEVGKSTRRLEKGKITGKCRSRLRPIVHCRKESVGIACDWRECCQA